ncbi:hypothetical protein BZG36_04054 [Bifiguratus adelaidae]|uniref:BIR-domain-containing protein n=1 Tax=Bifiguratus adelaidae TaxID=1938954 RepID=A0A261XWH9_9FUNG|nr:hypothetical protein BZG36_04054 [Bifiguratus adelaidae]
MEVYENRVDSFYQTEKPFWPYLHDTTFKARPQDFARAGFYFDPSPDSDDSVRCFICGKSMEAWEPDDDPLQEHSARAPGCPWVQLGFPVAAEARMAFTDADVLKVNLKDERTFPKGKHMEDVRYRTFGDRWPHEGRKGYPRRRGLAKAGWYFCPSREASDQVSCAYCGVTVAEWEPKDSPTQVHRVRGPDCPVFKSMEELGFYDESETEMEELKGMEISVEAEDKRVQEAEALQELKTPQKRPSPPLERSQQSKKRHIGENRSSAEIPITSPVTTPIESTTLASPRERAATPAPAHSSASIPQQAVKPPSPTSTIPTPASLENAPRSPTPKIDSVEEDNVDRENNISFPKQVDDSPEESDRLSFHSMPNSPKTDAAEIHLTEEQANMTVEAYIRLIIAEEVHRLRMEGDAMIQSFEAQAEEVRKRLIDM